MLVVALCSSAVADPRPRVRTSASLWVGHVWGETMSRIDVEPRTIDSGVSYLRLAAGIGGELGADLDLTVSLVADLGLGEVHGSYGGRAEMLYLALAAEADRPLVRCWRIGLRGSLGAGETLTGNGQILTTGLRARNRVVELGVDAIFERRGEYHGRAYANGLLIGAGLHGRPSRYIVPIAAGVGLLIGIVVVVGFAGATS